MTVGVRNPPKFHHRALRGDAQHRLGGLETGPSTRGPVASLREALGKWQRRWVFEGLHSVREETVSAACLPISWLCDLGQAHL